MANKKQKETEELLAGKNNEIDALKRRIAELEAELKKFHEREASIAAALTMAQQVKASTIEEAQKRAAITVEGAQKQAQTIISEAKEKADEIDKEARAKAAEMLSETEQQTQELLTASRRRTVDFESRHTAINTALLGAAAALCKYIEDYKDLYEETTGCLFDRRSDGKATAAVPDEYESPDQLFHTLLNISGAGADSKRTAKVEKTTTAVETEKDTEEQCDIPEATAMPAGRVRSTASFSESVAQMSPDSLKKAFKGETVEMHSEKDVTLDADKAVESDVNAEQAVSEATVEKPESDTSKATDTIDMSAADNATEATDKTDTEKKTEVSPDAAISELFDSLMEIVNKDNANTDDASDEDAATSPFVSAVLEAVEKEAEGMKADDENNTTEASDTADDTGNINETAPVDEDRAEHEAENADAEDSETVSSGEAYSGLISDKNGLSEALSFLFSENDSDE